MHEHQTQKEYGPGLAIVIITAIVVAAAFVLYGELSTVTERDDVPIGPSQTINSESIAPEPESLEIEQSLEQIEKDLAELQKFEEEYLDFSDLDNLDLDFNF